MVKNLTDNENPTLRELMNDMRDAVMGANPELSKAARGEKPEKKPETNILDMIKDSINVNGNLINTNRKLMSWINETCEEVDASDIEMCIACGIIYRRLVEQVPMAETMTDYVYELDSIMMSLSNDQMMPQIPDDEDEEDDDIDHELINGIADIAADVVSKLMFGSRTNSGPSTGCTCPACMCASDDNDNGSIIKPNAAAESAEQTMNNTETVTVVTEQ